MTLSDLDALAARATPGPWHERMKELAVLHCHVVPCSREDAAYIAACTPERIAALVACVRALTELCAINAEHGTRYTEGWDARVNAAWDAANAARAKLEGA